LVDAVYAYDKFGSKVGEDVRGRVIEFRKIDELVGKLGNANGRVVVVARSTMDAVRLRDKLGKAEVIYLPEYYEDAAKKVLKGVDLEVARVRHEGLGKGISPSMLREGLPGKDVESIRELSPGKGDLKDVIRDFLKKAPVNVATQAVTAGLSFLLGVGAAVSLVGSLAGRFLESVVGRWRKNRDEVLVGFVRLLRVAREVKNNYLCDERRNERLCDERLEAVFDEVAYEWGLNIEEFAKTITNIANIAEGKQLTEEEIKKLINDNLENFKKELDKINEKLKELKVSEKGQKIGVEVFFVDDVENGLLYGNFTVKDGVPKIITWIGTGKKDLETDLVDAGKFREVAEEVFSKLVKDGRVVLIGPRGIGKSTLATYVVWRSLFGGLDNMVLNEPVYAVIRVDSLNPGYALALNNLIKTDGRRFVVIYDPSSVMAYYKPEAMQVMGHGNKSVKNITLRELIEIVKNTLKELIEVRNAWVVIILPRELYEQVQRGKEEDVDLRQVLDNLERDVVTVNLRNEVFLREIIKRYSECNNVSDDMVRRVMNFDSYTLVAKYAGVWLHEKKCEVEDVEKALRESAGKPKLFFAHYIWSVILGKSMDLAMKVSVPLILHATVGPIPEGITYITKAVNKDGTWKLIDRDRLAESKLEDLREDDLEPIAKWLSTLHEDLIEETLEDLVGLHGEEARNNYRNHGFESFIKALDWG
jgi:tetrahydromethanopterin S-methyltransferase subunit G